MQRFQYFSQSKKVAVLAASGPSHIEGRDAPAYDGLLQGLGAIGCEPELITLPSGLESFESTLESYRAFSELDLSRFDAVVSSGPPTYAVSHAHHVVYIDELVRAYYDQFTGAINIVHARQRQRIIDLDRTHLTSATLIFCQSHATASMLYRWLGVRSQVLRPPAAVRDFRQSSAWSEIASQLLGAALTPQSARAPDKTRVTVLDVQPIDPPTGGGRLRLLGLYHALGEHIDCRYVGTYDSPGGTRRSHRVSPCLDATYVPLSLAHHKVADQLRAETGGKTVFDVSFSRLAHLSPAFVSAARESIKDASIIVFSHPWVYPLVADALTQRQLVVYDSHNVEGYLRAQLLDRNNPTQATLLRQVLSDEYALGNRADLIFACSQEDLELFARIYDVPFEKLRIVPNGAMAEQGIELDRKSARHQLKLQQDKPIAIFVGSAFGPNLEAAHFIINRLADILPEMTFVIAGSVGNDLQCEKRNVVVTGSLEEAEKLRWLAAADLGINPMCSGSGTNIKMFELMAMRLPIVSTAVGARGIDCGGRKSILIVDPDPDAFATAIRSLCDEQVRLEIGEAARACLEDGYAWERISPFAGAMMHAASDYGGQPKPFFSVVIPSYERPQGLDGLFQCLQAQVERDFEVIIVDQSKTRWRGADGSYGFPFRYWQTPVRGAVRARNTGASLAQGDILAFTDDDCLPEEFWLFNARKHFAEPSVAGIEGQIVSDHLGDPSWRPVTNLGGAGFGFMSANLMVRQSVFQRLGGYDYQFDHPHFREDTDLGWRMQEIGTVPYAADVTVFHPAQPRALERESIESRARFFEKDATLYWKHPRRYKELFFRERQYAHNKYFGFYLKAGFEKLGMDVPSWIDKELKRCA